MASPPLTNREYAYLRISGKGDHLFVSKRLGLEPTNCWSEGDVNPRNNIPRKLMSWKYESGLDDTYSIEEHIKELFKVLEPLEETLVALRDKYELCIQCVGYFPASGHGINLNYETISKAASLGLSFDYDFYYVDDHGHDLDYQ